MEKERRCGRCGKPAAYSQRDAEDGTTAFLCNHCYQWLSRGMECWSSAWQAEDQHEELAEWEPIPISEFSQ